MHLRSAITGSTFMCRIGWHVNISMAVVITVALTSTAAATTTYSVSTTSSTFLTNATASWIIASRTLDFVAGVITRFRRFRRGRGRNDYR